MYGARDRCEERHNLHQQGCHEGGLRIPQTFRPPPLLFLFFVVVYEVCDVQSPSTAAPF